MAPPGSGRAIRPHLCPQRVSLSRRSARARPPALPRKGCVGGSALPLAAELVTPSAASAGWRPSARVCAVQAPRGGRDALGTAPALRAELSVLKVKPGSLPHPRAWLRDTYETLVGLVRCPACPGVSMLTARAVPAWRGKQMEMQSAVKSTACQSSCCSHIASVYAGERPQGSESRNQGSVSVPLAVASDEPSGVGGLGGIAASGSGDPVPSITTKRDITQTGPDLVPLQHGPVLHGVTDPEELKGEQVEINVCIRHLEDSQGGLHRAKGLGHGQHPGAGPSLPGFPPGPLALISLELCKEALPHTAPPSETKGPARLTSPHTRTLRADLDTQPRRDTNLKGQGAGPREGGRRAALSTSERAAQPGSPQPRKELEGARRMARDVAHGPRGPLHAHSGAWCPRVRSPGPPGTQLEPRETVLPGAQRRRPCPQLAADVGGLEGIHRASPPDCPAYKSTGHGSPAVLSRQGCPRSSHCVSPFPSGQDSGDASAWLGRHTQVFAQMPGISVKARSNPSDKHRWWPVWSVSGADSEKRKCWATLPAQQPASPQQCRLHQEGLPGGRGGPRGVRKAVREGPPTRFLWRRDGCSGGSAARPWPPVSQARAAPSTGPGTPRELEVTGPAGRKRGHWAGPPPQGASGLGRGARGAGLAPPRRLRPLRPRAGSGWSPPASGSRARGVPAPPPPLGTPEPEPGGTPHPTASRATGRSPRAPHRPRPGGHPCPGQCPLSDPGPNYPPPPGPYSRCLPLGAHPYLAGPRRALHPAPSRARGAEPSPGSPTRARRPLPRTCKNAGGGRAASRAPARAPAGARASFRVPATPVGPASAPGAPGPGSARSAAAAAGPGTHRVLEAAPGAGGSEKRAEAGTRAGGRPQPGAGSACSGARRRAPAPGRQPRALAARLTLSWTGRSRGQPAGRAGGAGCGLDPSHRVQTEFESNSSATTERETETWPPTSRSPQRGRGAQDDGGPSEPGPRTSGSSRTRGNMSLIPGPG
ncbi:collagen alpha-1(I) chain-like [Cervus canadensis]|uniref:collagen alpha-1(I) chain-like n=1 Tax=Cervus canadensis TaxID=1574408 RepID=UPI001CA3466C|nr:collagen alpha-1(I) chain-like [Cervus canadensis]